MNRAQACSVLGWTAYEFDKAVAKGFPAKKRHSSRGQDWSVDSREAVAWVAEQEVAKVRPRDGKPPGGPDDEAPEPPPPYRVLARLENPVDQGFMLAHLDAFYHLPRLVACLAAGLGMPMDAVHELTRLVVLAYADHVAEDARKVGLEPWASAADGDPAFYELDAFAPLNWPNLAHKRGEPDWAPPHYCCGWVEYTAEERAANILPAREADEDEARGEPARAAG